MSVVRTQYVTEQAVSVLNNVTTVIDVVRPVTTPAQPPYAENTDYVTRPRHLMEEEAGAATINLQGNILNASIYLRAVEVWQAYPTAQTGLTGVPMFPSGSTPAQAPSLVNTVYTSATGLATNTSDNMLVTLRAATGVGGLKTAQIPAITLGAGQFVRLRFYNNAAGDQTGLIQTSYDFGVNNVEYRKL
jgi:hypothetical protein